MDVNRLLADLCRVLDPVKRNGLRTLVQELKAKKAARWGRVAAVGKRVQMRLKDIGFARSPAPRAPEDDLVLGDELEE